MKKTAVFLDAENISIIDARIAMNHIKSDADLGEVILKRAYGDFGRNLHGIIPDLHDMGFMFMATPSNSRGKNAADFMLVMDAIEINRDVDIDCFILISSDTGFSVLANKLKEAGREVQCFSKFNNQISVIFDRYYQIDRANFCVKLTERKTPLVTGDVVDGGMELCQPKLRDVKFSCVGWGLAKPFVDLFRKHQKTGGQPIPLKGLTRSMKEADLDLCQRLGVEVSTVINKNKNLFPTFITEGRRYVGFNEEFYSLLVQKYERIRE